MTNKLYAWDLRYLGFYVTQKGTFVPTLRNDV